MYRKSTDQKQAKSDMNTLRLQNRFCLKQMNLAVNEEPREMDIHGQFIQVSLVSRAASTWMKNNRPRMAILYIENAF